MQRVHQPVMLKEVLEALRLKPGMKVLDCTIGGGGHAKEILEKIHPNGSVVGIDRDREVLDIARSYLRGLSITLVHRNFTEIDRVLEEVGWNHIDAALFDLGVSSYQLETPHRGFSFQQEGDLDMRMDSTDPISAFDLVNHLSEVELADILSRLGQERYARRIAHAIIEERRRNPIATTKQLAELVNDTIPRRFRMRIHPATRTFQAFRIQVNRELESLEAAIPKVTQFLVSGGRLCMISFHSLEDRIVKLAFRKLALENQWKIATKKPMSPSTLEIEKNPRARSAKMRVGEKI